MVNISQTEARTVVVQTGAYGEHECIEVRLGDRRVAIDDSSFEVRLAPGCGAELLVVTKPYANRPSLSFPWSRRSP